MAMDELTFDNLYQPEWTQMMFSGSSTPSVVENAQLYNLSPDDPNITNDAPQEWIDALPQESSDSEDAGILGYKGQSIDPDSDYATLLQKLGLGTTEQSTTPASAITTGADAVQQQKPTTTPPASKESSLMDILNSKMGAGVATQLVGGLLGGLGSGAAAKANNKAQNDLLDKKYNQQLDYIRQMRKAGTIQRQNWAPSLSSGILGSK